MAGNPAVRAGLIGALVAIPLVRIAGQNRKRYLGPLRVYFSERGLHLQDPINQSRISWDKYVGFLEDKGMLLLYTNPKVYRIIPKRALTGQAARLQAIVQAKLSPFDYRTPTDIRVISSPEQPS